MKLLALFIFAGSSSQYTPSFPGGIVAWIVCNGRKRQQIGGWLLFYYWQIYSGVLLSTVLFLSSLQNYVPDNFDDRSRFYLSMASAVPTLIFFVLQVTAATILVSIRTWDMVRLLRALMAAELFFATVGAVIDAKYFPDNLPFDFITIVPAALWLAYWFRSTRVKHVFENHDWETAVEGIYPLTPKVVT